MQGIEVFFVDAETVNLSEEYFLKENTFSFVDSVNDPPTLVTNITIIKALSEETQVIQYFLNLLSEINYRINFLKLGNSNLCLKNFINNSNF